MMKKQYNALWIVTIFLGILLSSCSSTNSLTISVIEPPNVYVPNTIKSIGIVDRSLPSKGNESIDALDKILSAEGKDLDKEGANQAVVGLYDELLSNGIFSEVNIIENNNLRNPGMGIFPSPLAWDVVDKICSQNKVDALFVLSFYDTDTKIDYKAVPVEVGSVLGVKIPAFEHHANVTTFIKTGWRIYDTANKLMLDEVRKDETVTTSAVGINPMKAVESIVGRKAAVLQKSNKMGHNYAFRVLPYRIRVSREYYVKGTNNFEIAKRRAQTGDWDGAAELWAKEVSSPKQKVAGRACYNMGIISEINGDLNAAMDWTSKSYTDYKNKNALAYLNVIKRRIEKNKQLQEYNEN